MTVHRRMIWGLAAVLLPFVSSAASAQQAWTSQQVTLDIQAQPLGQALNTFAAQTGLQIAGLSDAWVGLTAPRVVGTFSVQSALDQLLANTSLDYQLIGEGRAVAIRAKNSRTVSKEETAYRTANNRQAPLQLADGPANGVSSSSAVNTVAAADEIGADGPAPAPEASDAIAEVVVTGTHIRGEASAGSHVQVITKGDIEQSGHARLEDLFESLPQNFSGSGSEDSTKGVAFNVNRAATIDLRGLGTGTTLILINGHRQPNSDLTGAFVDISSIPSSAVERVEILTDGASAVYGSDAIGGVVNFILRKDYEGAETRARFGSLDGHADEVQLSQLFGKRWSGGSALIGYQYYERDPLRAEDIPYLATLGDQRQFGGTDFRTNWSNPGVILDSSGRPAYAIPSGQSGVGLTPGDLTPLNGVLPPGYPLDSLADRWYLAQEKLHTVFLSASHNLTDRFELFAEGRYGKRDVKTSLGGQVATLSVPSTNPFYVHPSGGTTPVTVAYNFHDDGLIPTEVGDIDVHSEAAGVRARFADWQIVLSGSYGVERNRYLNLNGYYPQAAIAALSSTDSSTALNLFGDGANNPAVIDSIRSSTIYTNRAQTWGTGIVADGPLLTLLDRNIRVALGADYRTESLDFHKNTNREFPLDVNGDLAGAENRNIKAAFAELAIPLVPSDKARPGVQRLELSLAGRYEDYSDFGKTTNPKVGLQWQLIDGLQLRGTWGTSFRAPKMFEMSPANISRSLSEALLNNPTVPGTRWRVLINRGPNPDLQEETADVWTAGFDFAPRRIPGFRVSMTYFDISYADKIAAVGALDPFRSMEALAAYAQFVTIGPPPQQVAALCTEFPGRCSGSPIAAIVNVSMSNLNKVFVTGVDFDIAQSLDTAFGTFDFGLGGTYLSRYDLMVVSGMPALELVDTTGNPLALRLRGKLSWGFKDWRTGMFINHTGGYNNPGGIPTKMDSFTTLDLSLSYRLSSGLSWLNNSRLSLSLLNITDERPPFLNVANGYDTANGDLTGRSTNLQLIKEW